MSNRSDTVADAQRFRAEFLRSLTGEQRVAMAVEMTQMADDICRQGIAAGHPEYSTEQVQRAFVRKILGDELFIAACPTEPLLEP